MARDKPSTLRGLNRGTELPREGSASEPPPPGGPPSSHPISGRCAPPSGARSTRGPQSAGSGRAPRLISKEYTVPLAWTQGSTVLPPSLPPKQEPPRVIPPAAIPQILTARSAPPPLLPPELLPRASLFSSPWVTGLLSGLALGVLFLLVRQFAQSVTESLWPAARPSVTGTLPPSPRSSLHRGGSGKSLRQLRHPGESGRCHLVCSPEPNGVTPGTRTGSQERANDPHDQPSACPPQPCTCPAPGTALLAPAVDSSKLDPDRPFF